MRVLLAVVCVAWGSAGAAPVMKLRSVRLYETGVGYFERSGRLDSGGVTLPVPPGHLDDALKTLVVLSPGGKVHNIEFGSSLARGLARTLAGLPAASEEPISYRDLLVSLKGAAVKVRTDREVLGGRLIDVVEESRTRKLKGPRDEERTETTSALVLLLFTDRSEVRRLDAADVRSVQPADPAFAKRLGSSLDALGTPGSQARRELKLAGGGTDVTLGYVAETPLWRTTYRLVLDAQGRSMLQGWALVHNDTDEDWRSVRTELVNGRPDSFLFPLAAPRYARRELVTPENELSTVPQLIDTTPDVLWGDHVEGAGSMGMVGRGSGGGGSGAYGAGMGRIGTVGHGAGVAVAGEGESGLLDVGNLAKVPEADGVEAGALFTYTLPEPLDLRAHGSALVPFLMQAVSAQPVTFLAGPGQAPRAAARFANSTTQTLPSGPISFFREGGFAGESAISRLKPREVRVVEFGADLDVQVSESVEKSVDQVRRLRLRGEALEEHFLRAVTRHWRLENKSGLPRSVHVGLPIVKNATVKGADLLDIEEDERRPVAVFALKGREKLERRLETVEGLSRATPLAKLTSAALRDLAAVPTLADNDRKLAREAADRQAELEAADKAAALLHKQRADAEADVGRMRENMKAAAQGGSRTSAFAEQVLAAESRLAELRQKLQGLEQGRDEKVKAVRAVLARL